MLLLLLLELLKLLKLLRLGNSREKLPIQTLKLQLMLLLLEELRRLWSWLPALKKHRALHELPLWLLLETQLPKLRRSCLHALPHPVHHHILLLLQCDIPLLLLLVLELSREHG